MGRRCRHISWKAMGAAQAFDARQIAGVTDGSTVQTWTDLGTGGNNASQASAGLRPIYRTGGNGINGGPVLEFDGSDDIYTHSFSSSSSSSTAMILARGTTALTPPSYRSPYLTYPAGAALRNAISSDHEANPNNKWWFVGYNFDGGMANLPDSSLVPTIVASSYDGSQYNVAINGSWKTPATAGSGYSDAQGRQFIGGEESTAAYCACKIAICCTIQPVPSRTMLNRIIHAISRSYKVAAS
jgi:hypothetical protein